MTVTLERTDVMLPTSAAEAVAAFGDGANVTVVAGGTIVMPEISQGRLRPQRALLLARAGLDQVRREDGTIRIGATAPISALESAPEPLATFARHVADFEIRAHGTVGGNLCAPPGAESPRGDLQAPLLALDARVRFAVAGGEETQPVEEFLERGAAGRLVLEIEVDEPARASAARLDRPHAHAYTILAVACAETDAGIRVAVAGAGPRARRAHSVEQALAGGADAATAARSVLTDVEPHDDALASAWYRRKMLPTLVERALNQL